MNICKILGGLALSVLLGSVPSFGQEKSVRPGINDPFKDPDLDAYVKKFEIESREVYAHRDQIVKALKLQPGQAVADVGAGTGLFTMLLAREVGPKGKVYAVDIAPRFLEHIRKSSAAAKVDNVTIIQCDQFSSKLPPNSVDLIYVCDTYHHFEHPFRTLDSLHKALKDNGSLVVIDFYRVPGKSSKFILGHVRADKDVFVREILAAGFRQVEELNLLKENYFVRFMKKAKS